MKVTITKAEWQALDEAQRSLYTPLEGGIKYRLTEAQDLVESANGRLDEFRENNRQLRAEVSTLSQRLEAFAPVAAAIGDRTPDEIRQSLERLATLEASGVRQPDDVTSRIEAALNPLRTQVQTLTSTLTTKDKELERQQLDALLSNAGRSAGVEDSMVDDFIASARSAGAVLKNGAVEFHDAQGVRRYGKAGAWLSIEGFIDELRDRKPRYFKTSDGFDLGGRPREGNLPTSILRVQRHEQHKYVKQIAAGTAVVVD